MSPVRADSRMPKGAMSFMKESIRVGFAELCILSVPTYHELEVRKGRLTPQQYSYSCLYPGPFHQTDA